MEVKERIILTLIAVTAFSLSIIIGQVVQTAFAADPEPAQVSNPLFDADADFR